MKIVSTTLSGNSESIIGDALRSVIDWVDECIVIDTGITDNTLLVASEVAGAKLRVEKFDWCDDFAKARNYSLECSAKYGADWAVTLDTDERINLKGISKEKKRSGIEYILSSASRTCLMVNHESIQYVKERFFKIPFAQKWVGPIHEAMQAIGTSWPVISPDLIVFSELEKTPEEYEKKFFRDASKLEEYVKDHVESRWFFYLGDAFQNLAVLCKTNRGDEPARISVRKDLFKRAIKAYASCFTINNWPEESATAAFRAAQCAYELESYSTAINLCSTGMTYHAGIPELPFIAGLASLKLGLYQQTIYWAWIAIRAKDFFPERTSTRFLQAYHEGPWDLLRTAYRNIPETNNLVLQAETMFRNEQEKRIEEAKGKHDANFSMPLLCGPERVLQETETVLARFNYWKI